MDHASITINTYNRQAVSTASKLNKLTEGLYREPLLGFRDLLPTGARILDLGCGPGNVEELFLASERDFRITGIDLSSELLSIARKRTPSVRYLLGDIRELPIVANSYDAVIASFCLPHLNNNEAMKLTEDIAKVLKPGGLCYISTMLGEGSTYEAASFSQGHILYYNFYSEAFLREALSQHGLDILTVYKQDYPEPDGGVTVDIFFYARART